MKIRETADGTWLALDFCIEFNSSQRAYSYVIAAAAVAASKEENLKMWTLDAEGKSHVTYDVYFSNEVYIGSEAALVLFQGLCEIYDFPIVTEIGHYIWSETMNDCEGGWISIDV